MQPIDIENVFRYHPPTSDKVEQHEAIRDGGRVLAHLIDSQTPDGPEKTLAIRHVQQAVMWANAGIACGGAAPEPFPPPPGK